MVGLYPARYYKDFYGHSSSDTIDDFNKKKWKDKDEILIKSKKKQEKC